jgi:hypothetical protein
MRIDGNGDIKVTADPTAGTEYTYTVSNLDGTETWTATARYDGRDAATNGARGSSRTLEFWPVQRVYQTKPNKEGILRRSARLRWVRRPVLRNGSQVGWVFIHPAAIAPEAVTDVIRDSLHK